jgi:uncharacterized membrane protein
MASTEDTNVQETVVVVDEEQQREEKISKLFKISKISILAMISILFLVSAVLGLISLYNEEGILDTPWVILGLILMVVVIVLVVIPLFRTLRDDIQAFNKEKEEKKNLEEEMLKTGEDKEQEF